MSRSQLPQKWRELLIKLCEDVNYLKKSLCCIVPYQLADYLFLVISYEALFSVVLWQGEDVFRGTDCQNRLCAEMPSSDLASLSSGICQKIVYTYCKGNLLSCKRFQQSIFPRVQSDLVYILCYILAFSWWKLNSISSINSLVTVAPSLDFWSSLKENTTWMLWLLIEA